jgi:uncharacterized membrane protein
MADWTTLIILFAALIIVVGMHLRRNKTHKNKIYSKENPLMLLNEQYRLGKIDQQEYKEKCALWNRVLDSYIFKLDY